MKKKIISAVLSFAMTMTAAAGVFAAAPTEEHMQELALTVKEKTDIPAEYSEFKISHTTSDEKISYNMSWTNPNKKEERIRVSSDDEGHIILYSRYCNNEELIVEGQRETAVNAVTEQVKKLLPECFENENDCYKKESDSFNMSGRGSVNYVRYKDGVRVFNNSIAVNFKKLGDDYKITDLCNYNDYEAVFGENADAEDMQSKYLDIADMHLEYNRIYFKEDGIKLRYVINDVPFMDAATGEKLEYQRGYSRFENAADAGGGSAAMKSEAILTEEELNEIKTMSGLKSADEIKKELAKNPEFSAINGLKVESEHVRKFKDDYYVCADLSDAEEGKEVTAYAYLAADAKTGKLVSLFVTNMDGSKIKEPTEMTDEEIAKINLRGETMLKKYGKDFENYVLKETTGIKSENGKYITENYEKLVNDVVYTGARASVTYDADTGRIEAFSINENMPENPSFTDPSKAIAEEAAVKTILDKYPITKVFVKSGDTYKAAYTLLNNKGQGIYVDALENIVVGPMNDVPIEDENEFIQYDDIENHWAKNVINQLAQFGIGCKGGSFRPDEEITANEFIDLSNKIIGGYIPIPLNEKDGENENLDMPVTRMWAVKQIIDKAGYSKVAELNGIFVVNFTDKDEIAAEDLGYCAIAQGMGIISGSDGRFNPSKNITRAEAVTMLYNYRKNN